MNSQRDQAQDYVPLTSQAQEGDEPHSPSRNDDLRQATENSTVSRNRQQLKFFQSAGGQSNAESQNNIGPGQDSLALDASIQGKDLQMAPEEYETAPARQDVSAGGQDPSDLKEQNFMMQSFSQNPAPECLNLSIEAADGKQAADVKNSLLMSGQVDNTVDVSQLNLTKDNHLVAPANEYNDDYYEASGTAVVSKKRSEDGGSEEAATKRQNQSHVSHQNSFGSITDQNLPVRATPSQTREPGTIAHTTNPTQQQEPQVAIKKIKKLQDEQRSSKTGYSSVGLIPAMQLNSGSSQQMGHPPHIVAKLQKKKQSILNQDEKNLVSQKNSSGTAGQKLVSSLLPKNLLGGAQSNKIVSIGPEQEGCAEEEQKSQISRDPNHSALREQHNATELQQSNQKQIQSALQVIGKPSEGLRNSFHNPSGLDLRPTNFQVQQESGLNKLINQRSKIGIAPHPKTWQSDQKPKEDLHPNFDLAENKNHLHHRGGSIDSNLVYSVESASNKNNLYLKQGTVQRKISGSDVAGPMERIWERLNVQALTWDRECHGLYDFDLKTAEKFEANFIGCGFVQRQKQNINVELPGLAQKSGTQPEIEKLLSLVYKQKQYWLFHNHSIEKDSYKHHVKMAWHIVRFSQDKLNPNENNRFYVDKSDIIKFGRVRFRIKKLNIAGDHAHSPQTFIPGLNEHIPTEENEPIGPGRANRMATMPRNTSSIQHSTIAAAEGFSQRSIVTDAQTMAGQTSIIHDNNNQTILIRDGQEQLGDEHTEENDGGLGVTIPVIKPNLDAQKYATIDVLDAQKQAKQMEEIICRICLAEEEPDNPIISPCNCTGSVKYIHLECIREWLEGKKHKKETPLVNSYIWRGLECEICKAYYEDSIILPSGREVSLLNYEIHPDAEKYMILESVTNSSSKTIHVVNFSATSEIKVGRGSQCEVRITDVSVSRHHASFELLFVPSKLIKNKVDIVLSVSDENSKFGTLVFVRKPIPLSRGQKVHLQVGRTCLTISSQERLNCFQRMFCMYAQLKKDQSGSVVHFDEGRKYFPREFSEMFPEASMHDVLLQNTPNEAKQINFAKVDTFFKDDSVPREIEMQDAPGSQAGVDLYAAAIEQQPVERSEAMAIQVNQEETKEFHHEPEPQISQQLNSVQDSNVETQVNPPMNFRISRNMQIIDEVEGDNGTTDGPRQPVFNEDGRIHEQRISNLNFPPQHLTNGSTEDANIYRRNLISADNSNTSQAMLLRQTDTEEEEKVSLKIGREQRVQALQIVSSLDNILEQEQPAGNDSSFFIRNSFQTNNLAATASPQVVSPNSAGKGPIAFANREHTQSITQEDDDLQAPRQQYINQITSPLPNQILIQEQSAVDDEHFEGEPAPQQILAEQVDFATIQQAPEDVDAVQRAIDRQRTSVIEIENQESLNATRIEGPRPPTSNDGLQTIVPPE